ncbi:ImmA/IrrE family metallo-endopeptidase [Paraburkholderia sp. Ac-20340]|uniref:XRE family transcriptional regulator n=1 Tax=Paraburkholderia sp. Ac-20340 TaxID=2703888 RepID=UPI001980F3E0|nr:XRE family transcriptional regulator [Paraburkholderia sp. Ac-20340]MBN3854248.1 ImmA/IrrE family metallo-endopeptidase [Paraburkholderia sp. Ac-20340]
MIGPRLHRARKAAGLSLRDLGAQVGLTHAAIKKYEDGQATPSSSTLLKLARTLNVRTEYFFRPETVSLDRIEYRKRSTLPRKRLEAIEHEVIDHIERRIELENLFPSPPIAPFGPVHALPEVISGLAQIECAAETVRKAWDLGYAPIPDLIDVLETHGIRVFMIDANADPKFDGLAASVGRLPVIVVGSNWPGDRQRFTLAHELGHLILADRLETGLDEELACNRFAGAFLIPRQSVIQELGAHRSFIEPKELALLKEEFGLSMAGLLYRARDLGIVSPAWRDEQAKQFRSKGWHITEPGKPYPAQKAHVFEQMVFHALAEDYIGESKAAELLSMSLIDFRAERALEGSDAATHQ